MTALISGLVISPGSTRPWQHVLEPLSGYLQIASSLHQGTLIGLHSFNFGPSNSRESTVLQLVSDLWNGWSNYITNTTLSDCLELSDSCFSEAGLLHLNCDKASSVLGWSPALDYNTMIEFVSSWYASYHKGDDITNITIQQLSLYQKTANLKSINWTLSD